MTRQELIHNLGTLAKLGTRHYKQSDKNEIDISALERFGIGFYSAFLVADKVSVISKSDDEEKQYKWESSAGGAFTVSDDHENVEQLRRGTKVILYLKDDNLEFLKEMRLRDIVKKYSEFIVFPIELQVESLLKKEISGDEDEDEKRGDSDIIQQWQYRKKKKSEEIVSEWITLNLNKPIWMREPETITREEYSCFYKSITYEFEGPLAYKHFSVEGQLEFKGIVYIPMRAPFDMFESVKKGNMKLYVRRVRVMVECEELLPEYLSFVKGVVDSEDLPLGISRELLQQNKIIKVMRKNIVRKVIELIQEVMQNKEDHRRFCDQYSSNIKFGIYEDSLNRNRLADFLRYFTSKSGDEQVSLKDYVSRMKEGQREIYFITGKSKSAAENSPCIEALRKRGYEVIYMIETIDECVAEYLREYDNKKLRNCAKEGFVLDAEEADAKRIEELKAEYENFCKVIERVLGDKIQRVILGTRIIYSPCVLVTAEYGWTSGLERIIKPHTLIDPNSLKTFTLKKIMEINPSNLIIRELMLRSERHEEDEAVKGLIWVLYETASLLSGLSLDKPDQFASRIYRMMKLALVIENENGYVK